MSHSTPTSGGGIAGSLLTYLLGLFVLVGATGIYYGLRSPALPLDILRQDLQRVTARAPADTTRWLKATTVRQVASLSVELDRQDASGALRDQLDKLRIVAPLVTLRALLLILALPLLLPAAIWALLEGLWTRERIALSTGFSSAVGFGLGKGLCLAAALLACIYVVAPWRTGPEIVVLALLFSVPAGGYLLGRNLPLHF